MPSTTSERLAVKRSLRDIEQLSAANEACESLSNKSFRLEAVLVQFQLQAPTMTL